MASGQVRIEPVSGRSGIDEFIDLQFRLYRDDPLWVEPLKHPLRKLLTPGQHPFFEHAEVQHFMARDSSGSAVGRVSAVVNRAHNEYHSDSTGFFGFLEGVRDREVFAGLLDAAAEWVGARGMDSLRGPVNYSTNEETGLLVKGFDSSPVVMMTYNPRWYAEMLEQAGMTKAADLLAYRVDRDTLRSERFGRIAKLVSKRSGAVCRPMDMRHFREEVAIIRSIYNECWKHNWGFVPMTDREFDQMSRELRTVLIPDFAPIVEVAGEPVAFAAAVADANQAVRGSGGSMLRALLRLKVPPFRVRPDGMRVLLLGVRESHRRSGLECLLIDRIVGAGLGRGYDWAELSWVLEQNTAMRSILENDLGAVPYKTYRIYERPIRS